MQLLFLVEQLVAPPSVISSPGDSMQRQQYQTPMAAKGRSNSLSKTSAISRVGYQLNCKKNKVENYPIRKPETYSTQLLSNCLSNILDNEDLKDATCMSPMSKSLVGGSMNICKTRALNFVQTERIIQGNIVSIVPGVRDILIMTEKPNDDTVAMHYGDIDDGDLLAAKDFLPTLPDTMNLVAAHFYSLMIRNGYQLMEDQIQSKQTCRSAASSSQANAPGIPSDSVTSEMQQYPEIASGHPSNAVVKPTNSGTSSLNSTQSLLTSAQMLPPGNTQALNMSQGFLLGVAMPIRSQQVDPQISLQQQQPNQHSLITQQHAQVQGSSLMLPTNPHSHLNGIGQNSNMQLEEYDNGTGNRYGYGKHGQQHGWPWRPGQYHGHGGSEANERSWDFGTNGDGAELSGHVGRPSVKHCAGMSGAGQMHASSAGLSMLGQTLNRAYISPLQWTAMASMGPPKMMSGTNFYINQQQQQQLQIQLQQQQIQQQQHISSPLQAVVSPPQVGSPSTMGIQQQLNQQPQQQQRVSPQKMSQQIPMSPQRLSSGALQSMNAGNVGAGPASPQLSSQTLGSVGSISSSPIELQGVNKSNSVSNV
ncbi:hypothetical protein HHK36_021908 [Tetracentron sinense]|uniref:PHL domain-containing protein n=1 Tax=Tetracentron sinense TaxID=13715 RepID=A0A835DAE3_TETSI|nr:hypothetical protein HHK36_021908 [Tetracentron sinense]